MFSFRTELLPHQKTAVEKLGRLRVGALFMEMGTGKTRTALELVARRLAAGKIEQVLWLAPCALQRTRTIEAEVERHCPELESAITVRGIESLSGSDRLFVELQALVAAAPTMLVVDESLLVKNHTAKRTLRVKALADACRYKLILNGTPTSKSAADLFAQYDILDWRILGFRSYYSFAARHVVIDPERPGIFETRHEQELLDKAAPYTYQVKKAECVKLPPKTYDTEYFSLGSLHMWHYRDALSSYLDAADQISERGGDSSLGVYKMLMAARLITSGLEITTADDPFEPFVTRPYYERPRDNPRVKALLDVVARDSGPCIVWCCFRHEVDDVTTALSEVYGEGTCAQFFGEQNAKERATAIDDFRAGRAQFLVANKQCGGFGLNLQHCSRMVFYSNDWDWGTRAQAEDRCHRIGQTEQVRVTDLVATLTFDSRILSSLWKKEDVCDSIRGGLHRLRDELRRVACQEDDDAKGV